MTLNKRYLRSIKSNRSFYIASSVLTMVSLLLFVLFYVAGTGIKNFGIEFFESQNLEDATFTTYQPINEDELDKLEDEYDVTLEREDFVNFKEGDLTVRLFRPTEKIDLYKVIEGQDIKDDDDILISAGYAENKNVKIGSKMKVNGKEYKVCGFFLRPDYCSALVEPTDSYKNISTFVFGYVSDAAFDEFGETGCTYKVVYNNKDKEKSFRKYVNKTYILGSYISKDDNTRITFVPEQADMFIIMSWVMLVTLPFVTVALIGIILGRKVKNEQKLIGTLAALGYSKKKLAWHYVWLAMIPGLVGGILVVVFAKIFDQSYGELCLADYEPLTATFNLPIGIAVVGVLVPTIIYMITAYLTVNKLLKKDTVDLLNGNADEKKHMAKIFYKKEMPVRKKFGWRSLLGNPGRTFVVFLGVFLGAYIVAFSFEFIDSIKEIGNTGSENLGKFKYEYVLNELATGDSEDGDVAMILSGEKSGESFNVMGADEDISLWNTELVEGGKAKLEKGWYISNLMASIYDLKEGDTFTFYNKYSLEKYSVKIQGIIANDYTKFVISTRENVYDMFELKEDYYNAIISSKKLNIDGGKIAETFEASSISDQVDTMLDEMNMVIYSLTVIGIIICIAALYVSVNMMVTENRVNISMLRVLGYKDGEISRMVLNANHILVPVGIVVGLVASILSMKATSVLLTKTESMIIPATITIPHIILTAVFVVLCYVVSLTLVKRKVKKVDMVESLKDNRE